MRVRRTGYEPVVEASKDGVALYNKKGFPLHPYPKRRSGSCQEGLCRKQDLLDLGLCFLYFTVDGTAEALFLPGVQSTC